MTILNYLLNTIGQAGEIPVFVYFNTNDTLATVTTPGYLNKFVAQGNVLSPSDMALVVTTDNSAILCNITHMNGEWSFAQYGGGSGPTVSAWLLDGNTDATMASFLGTQNAVPLDVGTNGQPALTIASDGSVVWSGRAPGLFWTLAAGIGVRFSLISMEAESILSLDSIASIQLGMSDATAIGIGHAAATTTINGVNLLIPGLPNTSSANQLFYDFTTGQISYDTASAGGAWLLAGNTLVGGEKFGSLNAFDVVSYANNVEVTRLVNSTGAFQVNANATIGGSIPASIIQGTSSTGGLILTGVPLLTGEPNAGSIALGGPTNTQFGNSVVLISPSLGGTLFINDVMAGSPFAGMFSQGLILGQGDSGHFGDATKAVITFLNQVSNPTTVGSGYATLYVGTDNELHFLNGTADYALTPPSGGGSGWNLTGSNVGAGLLLGTSTSAGFSIQQNAVPVLIFSSGSLSLATNAATTVLNIGSNTAVTTQAFNGWTASGIGDIQITTTTGDVAIGNMGSGSGSLSLVGHTNVTISCDTGDIDLLAQGTNNINLNGSGGTITVNVATAFTTALNLGSTSCAISVIGATFALQADGPSFDNTFGSLSPVQIAASNATALTIGNTSCATQIEATTYVLNATGVSDLHFQDSVDFDSPTMTIANSMATALTIGSTTLTNFIVLSPALQINTTGTSLITEIGSSTNSTLIDGTTLNFPNLAAGAADSFMYIDSSTAKASYASVATFSAGFWNTSGSNTGAGLKLGAGTGSGFQMTADNFAFFSVNTTIDINMGLNSFTMNALNDSQSINFANRSDVGSLMTLQVGTATPSTITLNPTQAIFNAQTIQIGIFAVTTTLTVANSACAMTVSPNTFDMNTVGTLHLGSGGAMSIGTGLSIDIAGPAVTLNTSSSTNTTTIGNVLAGNNIVLNSASIVAPNIGTNTGTVAVPTHTPPAGFNYLCIDASGNIKQFSA